MALKDLIEGLYKKILEKSSSEQKIRYWRKKGMKIGNNCHLETMAFSTEPYLIEIGDHVAIAYGTHFITHDGGIWCFRDELIDGDIFGRIKIGNNVFIGMNCTILANSVIGDNCIIGAGSVVRGKYPDNSVIVGNPSYVIMRMGIQKFLYQQNAGYLHTKSLIGNKKEKIIRKHFGPNK